MDRLLWDEVRELVGCALSLPVEERSDYLAQASSGTTARQAAATLIASYEQAESFLEQPASNLIEVNAEEGECLIGRRIGAYEITSELGRGGMGAVYKAKRADGQFEQEVAIKLITRNLHSAFTIGRFKAERQILATLDHPNIAKLLDGGTTEDGLPYLVMELVHGAPIDEYAAEHDLIVAEKLILLQTVCSAVQHAHTHLVVHRDIKPSNILVTGEGIPKLLDFGIAKLLDQSALAGTGERTIPLVRLLTPEYGSPEQVRGETITTASDVYSLGVVLFKLLTGCLPYTIDHNTFEAVSRAICEVEPPRPSTIASTDRRKLRGDLDNIVLKAMSKDPSRRYATASELAADIGRCLWHQPVAAHAPSVTYRTRKYIRRHRIGATIAAGLIMLLSAFAVVQGVQLRRITRERDRADRITSFMTSMFKVSDPSEARGNKVTAREILDKASKDIDTGLAIDPELRAQMTQVMGDVYDNLGLYSRAESLLGRAVEIRRRVLGPNGPATLKSRSLLSRVLAREGRYVEAEKLGRETLEIQRRVLGSEHQDTLLSMNRLGDILLNEHRYGGAEKIYRETLYIQRRVLGPEHPDTLLSINNLAGTLSREHNFPEAEKLGREVLDIQRRVLGLDHPDTLNSLDTLGTTLWYEDRYSEAEALYRQALDIRRRVLGPDHPNTLISMNNLANVLGDERRYAEAENLHRQTLDIRRRVLGPEHPYTLISMYNLADTLLEARRYPDAEKLFRQTLDIQRRVLGPEHPYTVSSIYNLACIAAHRNNKNEAVSLLRQAVDNRAAATMDLGIESDPDFNSLHGDPRFTALVAYAKQKAAAATKTK